MLFALAKMVIWRFIYNAHLLWFWDNLNLIPDYEQIEDTIACQNHNSSFFLLIFTISWYNINENF